MASDLPKGCPAGLKGVMTDERACPPGLTPLFRIRIQSGSVDTDLGKPDWSPKKGNLMFDELGIHKSQSLLQGREGLRDWCLTDLKGCLTDL